MGILPTAENVIIIRINSCSVFGKIDVFEPEIRYLTGIHKDIKLNLNVYKI